MRVRLFDRLGRGRVGVVEAGGGFGKTVLAEQYRHGLGIASAVIRLSPRDAEPALLAGAIWRGLRAARLSDLAAAVEGRDHPDDVVDSLFEALAASGEPVLLVVDDAHHLGQRAGRALLTRLGTDLPGAHRALVLSRTATPVPTGVRLCSADLAFSIEEVAEWLRSSVAARDLPEHAAAALAKATGGWPAALALAGARIAAAADPLSEVYEIAQSPTRIGRLVDGVLDVLGPEDRGGLAQLAHLPLLSPAVADAVTGRPGLLARATAAGVPMSEGAGGWERFADPVAEHLRGLASEAPGTAQAAGAAYLAAGEVLVALTTLLGGGLADDAAAVLATLTPDRLERLGAAEVRAVVEALPPPSVRSHPRALLCQARLSELSYRAEERADALRRCRELATETGDLPLLREVAAEIALDRVREGAVEEAVRLAQEVLDGAGAAELSARARALDCLARRESMWGAGSPDRAAGLLRQAAAVSIEAGHAAWAAGLLVRLSQDVLYAGCRHEEAIAAIDEALELLAGRPRLRAVALIIRAEPLRELGRYAEARAAVVEARDLGRLYRDERALAYAAWEDMLMAAQAEDLAAGRAAANEVERHRGPWFDEPTGIEFLAEAADAFDRLGDPARAERFLAQARSRPGAGDDRDLVALDALVEARSGDPAKGKELIDEALQRPDLPARLVWRLRLLGAFADTRMGDACAARSAAAAFELCADLGAAELALFVERAVADRLLPLAASAGSLTARKLLDAAGSATVQLFGRFEVVRAGRRVEIPPGRPAAAVKVLAARGGRMQADDLVEVLWPDGDPVAGRARLRNVLSRVRSSAGKLLIRDGESVGFGPGVVVDAAVFEAEARKALRLVREDRRQALTVARAALARYQGALAPDDSYEDWAASPRERLRALHLDLLDLLAAEAERDEQPDEAVRLLMAAIDAEPYDEARYRKAAELLVSQGRVGSARALRTRAERALGEIGITASFEVP